MGNSFLFERETCPTRLLLTVLLRGLQIFEKKDYHILGYGASVGDGNEGSGYDEETWDQYSLGRGEGEGRGYVGWGEGSGLSEGFSEGNGTVLGNFYSFCNVLGEIYFIK